MPNKRFPGIWGQDIRYYYSYIKNHLILKVSPPSKSAYMLPVTPTLLDMFHIRFGSLATPPHPNNNLLPVPLPGRENKPHISPNVHRYSTVVVRRVVRR